MEKISVSRKLIVFTILAIFIVSSISLLPLSNSVGSSTVIFQSNKAHYSGIQRIFIGGLISPAPNVKGTYVSLSISNPNGLTVDANQFLVLANYGTFTGSFVTGGPAYKMSGTYTISANYNGATASVKFSYSA